MWRTERLGETFSLFFNLSKCQFIMFGIYNGKACARAFIIIIIIHDIRNEKKQCTQHLGDIYIYISGKHLARDFRYPVTKLGHVLPSSVYYRGYEHEKRKKKL